MPPRHHLMLALCLNLAFVLSAPAAPDATEGAENPVPTAKAHVPMAKLFADADTDKDNAVTLAEIRVVSPEFSEDRFKKMDENANGLLERREAVRKPKAKSQAKSQAKIQENNAEDKAEVQIYAARLITQFDSDGDGTLTFDEVQRAKPGFPRSTFAMLDSDKDGVLSNTESSAPAKNATAPKPEAKPEAKAKKPGENMKKQGKRLPREGDTNNDGKLSFEEAQIAFPNITPERFQKRDRNGDGFLSPEDRKVAETPES